MRCAAREVGRRCRSYFEAATHPRTSCAPPAVQVGSADTAWFLLSNRCIPSKASPLEDAPCCLPAPSLRSVTRVAVVAQAWPICPLALAELNLGPAPRTRTAHGCCRYQRGSIREENGAHGRQGLSKEAGALAHSYTAIPRPATCPRLGPSSRRGVNSRRCCHPRPRRLP